METFNKEKMTKLFVQWILDQLLIVEVSYFKNYYIKMEVLFPFPWIKADYFSESIDFTKDENAWVIKNFINRNAMAHLCILRNNKFNALTEFLKEKTSEEVYNKLAIDLIHDSKHDWWEDSYMKYFSTKTIASLSKHIKKYIHEGCVDFENKNIITDDDDLLDDHINQMANVIKNTNAEDVYFFLSDQRFNEELDQYYRKTNAQYSYEVLVGLHESYYSDPCHSFPRFPKVLIEYYKQLSSHDKEALRIEAEGTETWTPYTDVIKDRWYLAWLGRIKSKK